MLGPTARVFGLLGLVSLAACAGVRPHPRHGGYALERRGRHLVLLVAPGTRGHRFQGTIAAHKGRVLGAIVSRAELRDRVALDGEVLQFDLEPSTGVPDEIELAVTHRCAKLELLIDGRPAEVEVVGRGVRVDRRGVACHR